MRGLKPGEKIIESMNVKSHLLQMRGLKLFKRIVVWVFVVASFTDAWIETYICVMRLVEQQSHLLQMRGLKHFDCTAQLPISRRIFYRCVD